MKVYQLHLTGTYKNFNDKVHFSSKNVYRNYPSEKDKDNFIAKCNPDGLFEMVLELNDDFKIQVVELELIENIEEGE